MHSFFATRELENHPSNLTILFDCDGVLVDSEEISISVELKYLRQIGLEYNRSEYQNRLTGLSSEDYNQLIRKDYSQLNKGKFPTDFTADIHSERWARFEAELKAVEGIEGLLKRISCTIAVVSSSKEDSLKRKLKLTKLYSRFRPHIYSRDQVERGKPSPDLYLFAARQLNKKIEDCIVIEDSVNGVLSGKAAGMTVWGFTGGSHADNELHSRLKSAGANEVFANFQQVSSKIYGRIGD